MKLHVITAMLVPIFVVAATPATADVIVMNDGSRIFGVVDSEEDQLVRIRVDNGKLEEDPQLADPVLVRRSDVRALIRTIDPERLASLKPGDWQSYLEYAEELAGSSEDPTARRLAIRLLLICLHHSGESQRDERQQLFRKTAAALLAGLAKGDPEIEILAYLAGHGDAPMQKTPRKQQSNAVDPAQSLKLVRAMRQERFAEAASVMDENGNAELLARWKIGEAELNDAIEQKSLNRNLLIRLIKAELELGIGDTGTANLINADLDRHRRLSLFQKGTAHWIPKLEELMPIDLDATTFADNKWLRPDSDKVPARK